MFFKVNNEMEEIAKLLSSNDPATAHDGLNRIDNAISRWNGCFMDSLVKLLSNSDDQVSWHASNVLLKFKSKCADKLISVLENKSSNVTLKIKAINMISSLFTKKRSEKILKKIIDVISEESNVVDLTDLKTVAIDAITSIGINKKYSQYVYSALIGQILKSNNLVKCKIFKFFNDRENIPIYNLRPLINCAVMGMSDKNELVKRESLKLLRILSSTHYASKKILSSLHFIDNVKDFLDLEQKDKNTGLNTTNAKNESNI